MKLTGIVAAAALFATNVVAQSSNFNLTALNGTWYAAGLTKSLFRDVRLISRLFNLTVTCPQVYITGNSSDTIYIQPSLQVGWWNASTHSAQKANVSMSGLLTLENSEANSANFSGQFSNLNASKPTTSTSNAVKMLDIALAGLSVRNPLPQGPALEASVNIQVTPGSNGTNVLLFSASNFTFPAMDKSSSRSNETTGRANGTTTSNSGSDDDEEEEEDHVFQVLLVQNASTFDKTAFESSTQAFGDIAANITQLNNTCSGTGSSSSSTNSSKWW